MPALPGASSPPAPMTGSNQHLVSDFFKPAGTQRAYWNAVTHSGGQLTMSPSGGYADGIRQVQWLAKVPKLPTEGFQTRTGGYVPVAVKLGARTGVTHARIRFGNNPSFECNSGYKTACLKDATITPYAFSHPNATDVTGTALAATACASGCTLTMRVLPGEVLWYQIETGTSATGPFTADPVQVIIP